jgi:hypothetical protein
MPVVLVKLQWSQISSVKVCHSLTFKSNDPPTTETCQKLFFLSLSLTFTDQALQELLTKVWDHLDCVQV